MIKPNNDDVNYNYDDEKVILSNLKWCWCKWDEVNKDEKHELVMMKSFN